MIKSYSLYEQKRQKYIIHDKILLLLFQLVVILNLILLWPNSRTAPPASWSTYYGRSAISNKTHFLIILPC